MAKRFPLCSVASRRRHSSITGKFRGGPTPTISSQLLRQVQMCSTCSQENLPNLPLSLAVDEQRLLARYRELRPREKRGVLALVDAIVAPPRRPQKNDDE